VTLVEMCSHLATERAGMGTLHLTVGAPELYPNPTRKESESILAPSLAGVVVRRQSKRRQGYRWAGRLSFEKR
jgi:hypothetical protein